VIGGFAHCTSLCQIEIPSSLEIIFPYGFHSGSSLSEVIFPWIVIWRRLVDFVGAHHSGKFRIYHQVSSPLSNPSLKAVCST
jgi:hypothetical protein